MLDIDPAELLLSEEPKSVSRPPENPIMTPTRIWHEFIKPVLRFTLLAILWLGMALTLFLIFVTLVSGFFFWEGSNQTFWQSAGQGIIGAAVFVPFFALLYYSYRRISKPAATAPHP